MAVWKEWTPEAELEFERWLADKPDIIKELAAKYPPYRLFRLPMSGSRVFVTGYNEDGTLTVMVSGEFNAVMFERQVFGVPADELVECDLPGPDEPTGVMCEQVGLSQDEAFELAKEEVSRRLAAPNN